MKVIVLGGTGFFGPHLVEALLAKRHEVTLFNRGKTNPQLFPNLEKLQGDRDPNKGEGIKALEGKRFDACIDNSGYFPRMVKASAETLAKNGLKQYVFISSISAIAEEAMEKGNVDETAPVAKLEDPTVEEMGAQFQYYGGLKALCEQAAEAAMPGKTTNIRPGLIVGPGDPTDRYTYWPVRIDRGGEVLAPNCPEAGVQYIDVRDLADWSVKMIEDGHVGIYNAVGPKHKLTWTAFLYGCKGATTSDARFTWVDEPFLLEQGVGPWMELPLWIPTEGKSDSNRVNNEKAISVGLTFRPAAVTAKDTIDWFKEKWPQGRDRWRAGLKPEKEQQVLAAWHAKQGTAPATKPS
jgi:2'-hydroxyisoflavone reductase